MDTAKFDDAYFKAAESKKKGSKKTEDGFFNEVWWPWRQCFAQESVEEGWGRQDSSACSTGCAAVIVTMCRERCRLLSRWFLHTAQKDA